MDLQAGLFLFYILECVYASLTFVGPRDYCEHENFEAVCGDNEVIVMKSAQYGRISLGRCIKKSFGYIGCSLDALNIMDGLCSGLRSCTVAAHIKDLVVAKNAANVCPGLSAYLVASYTCIPGSPLRSQTMSCQQGNPLVVQDKEGFLSSSLSTQLDLGSTSCPWRIVMPGYVVNLTLYKFAKQSEQSLLSPSSPLCYEVGKIREGKVEKNMMACGTDPRLKVIHLSHGAPVDLWFTDKAVLESLGRFLIYYTGHMAFPASKCELPLLPKNTFASISGNDVTIQCNNSDIKWTVGCGEIDKWKSEDHGCPTGEKWKIEDIFSHDEISLGVVLVVALGLTVFICAVGFIVYLMYYYCKRCKQNAAHQTAVNTRDYTDEDKKGAENLIQFPPENDVKYRENTLKSNAGSSDTSSLDKRTISWPIRESFRHSSHADTLQFPDENESESVSVEDETINSLVPSEEVQINVPDYGLPRK